MALAFEVKPGPATARVRSGATQSNRASMWQFVVWKMVVWRKRKVWKSSLVLPVFSAPSFHERHSNRAHSRQLVNGFEALRHWLRQKRSKLLIVEYLQVTTGRDLAHRRRMPSVAWITVWTLNENAWVAETFGEHFTANVVQSNALADMSSRLLHDLVTVYVGQQPKAEALRVRRICEPVNGNRGLWGVESFADAQVEFVITDGAPEGGILVHDGRRFKRLWGRQMWETWNGINFNARHLTQMHKKFFRKSFDHQQ